MRHSADMSQAAHLLSTAQVAEVLGVSKATVKRLALSGELPHALKLPGDTGAYLFDRKDVERLKAAA
jgi:excisionase family DNA binding protein